MQFNQEPNTIEKNINLPIPMEDLVKRLQDIDEYAKKGKKGVRPQLERFLSLTEDIKENAKKVIDRHIRACDRSAITVEPNTIREIIDTAIEEAAGKGK